LTIGYFRQDVEEMQGHHIFSCDQLLVVYRNRAPVARFAPLAEAGQSCTNLTRSILAVETSR
jgi:hypothetical protein